MSELWDAYDRQGNQTGRILVRGEPVPPGDHHLVVHIWFRNARGELLIQQRAHSRELAPDLWAATGGSAVAGEDSATACLRETQEELGITPDMTHAVRALQFVTVDALVDVWLIDQEVAPESLHLQVEEVADARWATLDDVLSMAEAGAFWRYRYLSLFAALLRELPRE